MSQGIGNTQDFDRQCHMGKSSNMRRGGGRINNRSDQTEFTKDKLIVKSAAVNFTLLLILIYLIPV